MRMPPSPGRPDGGADETDASIDAEAGSPFDGGNDAGDAGDDAGDAAVQQGCRPNPNGGEGACREICPEACNGLDDDCDGNADESEDVERSCAAPHSVSVCQAGECFVTQCLGGFRDCDELPLNGCEVSQDDPSHCGTCGNVCNIADAVAGCADGSCVVASCKPGFGDCDGDEKSCETRTNSLENCGACGQGCLDVPNAVPSCATGSCGVGTCKAGFGDCDRAAANGCEQTLDSLAHCGGCDTPCSKASCSGGVCTAADCTTMPGRADCDGDEASCEIDLRTDANNCGACGNACQFNAGITPHAAIGCSASGCVATCEPGYGDCDGNYANGCEQPLNTLTHCGQCQTACAIPHATATCSTGSCQVQACASDWADCNDDKTSCETSLATPDHCGSCATVCNFPNAVEGCGGSAGNRVCIVAGCEANWADCDTGAMNGCERDVRTPATGGLGPCLPDNGCVKSTNGGREYYVCPSARNWNDARARCQLQARGDLAQIADATENTFVRGKIGTTMWIGHNDNAREGTWVWAHNRVPFWQSGVGTLPSQYASWSPGEPNSSGNCGAYYPTGQFDDAVCTNALPFVCEVIPDACPSDASKVDPGQCGCDVPDTDTDGDGYANCNDQCPSDGNKRIPGVCGCGTADTNTDGDSQLDCQETCDTDPNKTSPGACGCGTADTNTDGDSQLDCNEACDTDPNKTSAGVCGCGVADTDGDGDGTPNCNDGCPADATTAGACFPFTHTNFNTSTINYASAPTPTLNCGTTVINTTNNPISFSNWCGGVNPTYVVQSQSGGPEVIVIPLRGLTIASGATLRLQGTRPVIFAVRGNVVVSGTIDASASGTTAGAGGNWSCGGSAGGSGTGSDGTFQGGGGGGGGAFGTNGGRGQGGDNNNNYGAGGSARGSANITPLYGGCSGGNGGGCGSGGGAGGGAVQITASGNIDINTTIRANGGNGAACGGYSGGGGGGSGGAIVLESATRDTAGSTIQANGGNGADGEGISNGNGANGSTSSSSAGGSLSGSVASGGGGGGGGYGRIKR